MCQENFSFVGKLETLKEDLEALSQKFKDLAPLKSIFDRKLNSAKRKTQTQALSRTYLKQLTSRQRKEINLFFKEDFELFGYKFLEI